MVKNVVEYLLKNVQLYPDKVVFKEDLKQITYAELDCQSRRIANYIKGKIDGAKTKPISVYLPKGIECLIAFMGIVYSGNFYSPIDVKLPDGRINNILDVLKPELVITNAFYYKHAVGGTLNIEVSKVVDMEKMLECSDVYQIQDMLEQHLDIDPLYVLFTSGSTGIPKGVVINHRAVIDYTEWLTETFDFNEATIFGNQAPFYFDNSILDIYQTLKNGSTMCIIPENYFMFHGKLVEYINANQINTIFWVPSALSAVASSGVLEREKIETLEKVLFCGEVMPTKTLNEWKKHYPQLLYANLYGPTEITDVCTYYIIDRDFDDNELLPIGKACKNTGIIVLNEENKLVQEDEPGELCVRGICLSLGYYGDRHKTGDAFVQNPLNDKYSDLIYKTGDIVKYNPKGELLYLCRKDSQIKYRGHRIELGEIDSAGYAIEGVNQACTIYDGEKIIFYCSCDENLTEKEIYSNLQKHLPSYMLPKLIKIIDEIPLNSNGKLDRVWLKEISTNL